MMKDIRQSENWGKYLQTLGWDYEYAGDILVFIKKLGPASLIKIQRPDKITKNKLGLVDKIAINKKALFAKIETTNPSDVKKLEGFGYERNFFPLVSPSTVIINLKKSEKTIWSEFKKDAKYAVNRAEKDGLKTKLFENPNQEIQKEFWKLLSNTGKEKRFYVQPFSDLNAKIKSFKDRALMALTYKEEKLLSGSLTLIRDKDAFYEHAGTNKDGRKYYASYLQMRDLINYLKKSGIEFLDLEGIYDERFPNFTKNWMGFSFFKKKFGGEVIKFPAPYIKFFHPILKTLNKTLGSIPI